MLFTSITVYCISLLVAAKSEIVQIDDGAAASSSQVNSHFLNGRFAIADNAVAARPRRRTSESTNPLEDNSHEDKIFERTTTRCACKIETGVVSAGHLHLKLSDGSESEMSAECIAQQPFCGLDAHFSSKTSCRSEIHEAGLGAPLLISGLAHSGIQSVANVMRSLGWWIANDTSVGGLEGLMDSSGENVLWSKEMKSQHLAANMERALFVQGVKGIPDNSSMLERKALRKRIRKAMCSFWSQTASRVPRNKKMVWGSKNGQGHFTKFLPFHKDSVGDFIFIYSLSNPLDLVFSNTEAERDTNLEDANLRFHHRSPLLKSTAMSAEVSASLRWLWRNARQNTYILRVEDLKSNPVETIRALTTFVSERTIALSQSDSLNPSVNPKRIKELSLKRFLQSSHLKRRRPWKASVRKAGISESTVDKVLSTMKPLMSLLGYRASKKRLKRRNNATKRVVSGPLKSFFAVDAAKVDKTLASHKYSRSSKSKSKVIFQGLVVLTAISWALSYLSSRVIINIFAKQKSKNEKFSTAPTPSKSPTAAIDATAQDVSDKFRRRTTHADATAPHNTQL